MGTPSKIETGGWQPKGWLPEKSQGDWKLTAVFKSAAAHFRDPIATAVPCGMSSYLLFDKKTGRYFIAVNQVSSTVVFYRVTLQPDAKFEEKMNLMNFLLRSPGRVSQRFQVLEVQAELPKYLAEKEAPIKAVDPKNTSKASLRKGKAFKDRIDGIGGNAWYLSLSVFAYPMPTPSWNYCVCRRSRLLATNWRTSDTNYSSGKDSASTIVQHSI